PWWVSDNGTDLSTLYNSAGVKQPANNPLRVQVLSAPTGAVFNITPSSFVLSASNNTGGKTGKALFMFATEDGSLLAWNPTGTATQAVVVVPAPGGPATGAVYKGLAIAQIDATHAHLYATDFHNNKVDVFDENFAPVMNPGFEDHTLPSGYAPFGIQRIGSTI